MDSSTAPTLTRCSGLLRDGRPCPKLTGDPSGRCPAHRSNAAPRCVVVLRAGPRAGDTCGRPCRGDGHGGWLGACQHHAGGAAVVRRPETTGPVLEVTVPASEIVLSRPLMVGDAFWVGLTCRVERVMRQDERGTRVRGRAEVTDLRMSRTGPVPVPDEFADEPDWADSEETTQSLAEWEARMQALRRER